MFQQLITQKNDAMLSGGISFFYLKLGITEEERALISFEEVKKLDLGTSGTCAGMYDREGKLIKVHIKVNRYASVVGMLDVLAHELVHAKQHIRGEFTFGYREVPFFFGLFKIKILDKFHMGQSMTTTPYYDRICEQEAHKRAHDLTVGFLALIKKETDLIEHKDEEIPLCLI